MGLCGRGGRKMKHSSQRFLRRLYGACFLLLLLTNIVVLSGVAINRYSEAEGRIVLSEREFSLPYTSHKEDSGLSLRLTWRVADEDDESDSSLYWRAPAWFDAAKVAELGLTTGLSVAEGSLKLRKEPLPREVFIVLELAGEPYLRTLAQAERALAKEKRSQETIPADLSANEENVRKARLKTALDRVEDERVRSSRLFAVDAGLGAKSLRQKYTDASRYIIAKGLAVAGPYEGHGKKEIRGRIKMLLIEEIHVPLEYRAVYAAIQEAKRKAKSDQPRSAAIIELVYGSRFEPWIAAMRSVVGP